MADYDIPPDIAKNPVFRQIYSVPQEGGNQIILTNGLPRTGKSEVDLDFAYALYRGGPPDWEHKFDPGKHMAWEKITLQKNVRRFNDIGTSLIWEEAGIAEFGAHARQFWSESNISLSTLFQVMGFHRQLCFINLPMKIMLDKHLRLLSHVQIETYKIKKSKDRCLAKVWWVEMAANTSEAYNKYPRFIANGLRYRVKTISVPRAPKEIREEYLARSIPFKQWLEDRLITQEEGRRDASTVVQGKQSVRATLPAIADKIRANPQMYLKRRNVNGEEKLVWDCNAIVRLEKVILANAYIIRDSLGNPEQKKEM